MDALKKSDLLGKLTANGLLYEVATFSSREIIVHETTGHSIRKIGEMVVAIENDPELTESMKNTLMTLYVPLVACSGGDVPETYDDFLMMKDQDIEAWIRIARKMNPRIFALLDEQEQRLQKFLAPDIREKKRKKPTTSLASS